MKAILLLLSLVSIFSVSAKTIISCSSVHHHGNYLEINHVGDKLNFIVWYGESDENDTLQNVVAKKNGVQLKDDPATSWALRQFFKEEWQGNVITIRGKADKLDVLINFSDFATQAYLVVGDYVEAMNCNIPKQD